VGPLQLWSSKTKINDLTAFAIQLPRISFAASISSFSEIFLVIFGFNYFVGFVG